MRKLTFARNRAFITFCRTAMSIGLLLMMVHVQLWSQCTPQSNSISGTVFEDESNDGQLNASDNGLANILVTAYDSDGNAAGSDVSDTDGNYTISNLTDENAYRIEFQSSSSYYSGFQGEDNQSSVQFVNSPACEVDYGLTRAISSCGSNPDLILTCFVQGTVTDESESETIISLEHNFGVSSTVSKVASMGETGSVWGITQDAIRQDLYTASFVKQYAGLKYGPYAILKTELTGSKSTGLFVDVNNLIPQSLPGLTETDVENCAYGNQVGRVGLGNLIISPDSRTLYTAVLDENLVVAIDILDPTAAKTEVFEMPRPVGIDANEEYKIFALEWKDNLIYVGGTVTASYSKNKTNSMGVVMTLDPSTGIINEVMRTSYLKGFWQDEKPENLAVSHWFTDISFTDDGEMLLSFSDRVGHRYCKESTNRLDQQFPDLLMAAYDETTGQWVLENNGSINGKTGSGVGNGEGPGGGEFFGFDHWPTNPTYHDETALGSTFVLPGSDEVIVAVYDPLVNSYSGGLHRYSTIDGSKTGAIELYSHAIYPVFGKATGFGDIIAKCAVNTIEIGNLVWVDTNGNGMQDAGEVGIPNLTVNLYDEECSLVGTTTTNENGVYGFNNTNVDSDLDGTLDGVYPNTTYYIEIDNSLYDEASGLYTVGNQEFVVCTANAGSGSNDNVDCDAIFSEDVCLDASFIEVNTGETNHSFDIGFGTPAGFDLALKKEILGNPLAKVGKEMIFMITVYNQGGVSASEVTITDYLPNGFIFDPASNQGWTKDGDNLITKITQKILPGTNVSKTLKLVVNGSQANNYINVAEISEALDLSGEKATDIDSTPDATQENDNGGEPFTTTDNQVDDSGSIDEDDHDPAEPEIFDLAVRMTLADNKTYYAGDLVKFDINLYNQGNTDADLVKLINYFPADLEFNTELNDTWSPEGDAVVLQDENILVAGETRDYCIYFNISKKSTLSQIVSYIEIAASSPVSSLSSCDFDSTPDDLPGNDIGGEIFTNTDNEINNHGITDEDDHDPVVVNLKYVDFALMKTADKTRVKAGEVVKYTIEIINQGDAPAKSVTIVDYIPENMTLVDDNWNVISNNKVSRTIIFDGEFTKGEKYKTNISLKVADDLGPGELINYAEIIGAKDLANIEIGNKDYDSTPDDENGNDIGGVADSDTDNVVDKAADVDEDDHDPAKIIVIDANYESFECLENATSGSDGQFQDVFKITGPTGDAWYVFSSENYYDVTSPDPADGPLVALANGPTALLDEMDMGNGMSMYTITVIREDGDAGFIVLRSNKDDIETFNVEADNYTNIVAIGDQALCGLGLGEYCVIDPDPDLDYEWMLPVGAVLVAPVAPNACVTIDWSGVAVNADYEVHVAADSGCFAPGSFNVAIGTTAGAMSCLGDINISLNGECEVVVNPELVLTSTINPGEAYSVMLTTQSGEVIPNATLTSDHIGMTVTAKVIDGCSGNSCWSEILVEDKIKPTIVCIDTEIDCNKIDEFPGPFAEDNCGGEVTVTLLNEVTTVLSCDDYLAEITRTYQATDAQGNKSDACDMTLLVKRVVLDSIKFPSDLLMMDNTALNCDNYDNDMDGVADVEITGVPYYNNEEVYPDFDQICNTAITFEDKVRFINGVKKITRTWTAWEWWCSETETREHKQYIEIRDTEPPVITCPSNITVSAVGGDCEGTVSLPLPIVDDSCNPDNIVVTTKPSNGGIIKEGDSRVVSFALTGSPYTVEYTATDAAGLSSICEITVTVVDNIAPVAICDQNTVVGLNSEGIGYVYALNIDDGSYDACGLDEMLVRRMDVGGPFTDKAVFNCDDVGNIVQVELQVTDIGGLSNTCMTNVIVQDKHAPVVTSPVDVTIECGDSYLPLSQFGDFTYNDACEVTTTEDSLILITDCGTGTITRTFTAADNDGSDMGTQTITIINSDPFDVSDIVSFPDDVTLTISTCDIDNLVEPENLPLGSQYPVFNDDLCDNVTAGYSDKPFSLIDDPSSVCFVIRRTWTIADWCQKDANGNPFEVTDVQIINVINEKNPDPIVISPVVDTIVSTTCESGMVTFTATSGDCSPNELQSMIQVDIDSDFNSTGVYEHTYTDFGPSIDFAEMLPLGNHNIVVTFMNQCGNPTTTSFPIVITNEIAPAILCQKTIVALEPWNIDGIPGPDTEGACINIESLVVPSGTYHPCDVPFDLSFSANAIVTEMCFDCDDIGDNTVTVYAIDIFGNVSSCVDTVTVQDNNDTDICMDIKDCTAFITDTLLMTNQDCFAVVADNSLDVVQFNADCGDLTITHNFVSAPSMTTLAGAEFPLGETIVTWTVSLGSMSLTCELTITVEDDVPPTIDCGQDITVNTSSITSGCEYTATGIDPSNDDNCMVASVTHNYATAPSNTTLDGAVFEIGTTTVTFTVTDNSGNTNTCDLDITVIDNEGPSITCVGDQEFGDWEDGGDPDCAYIVDDSLDPTVSDECSDIATLTHNYTPAPSNTTLDGASFPLGTTIVVFTVTDVAGNTSTCDVEITVIDDVSPSVPCPADLVINDSADNIIDCQYLNTGIDLNPSNITENCIIETGFTLTHDYTGTLDNQTLDGAVFPVGETNIVWTVTDGAGNTGTCTLTVTVIDNTPPECVDQDVIDITIGGDQEIVLTTDMLNEQYTDECGIASVVFDPPTLDCDPDGLVDVNVIVTDENQNTSTCPIQFNVIADVNISCELNIDTVYLDALGTASIDADDVVNIIGGGCGIEYTPSLDISTFDCDDADNSPITLTISATADGFTEECGTALLVVLDTIAPVLDCVATQTLDDSDVAGGAIDDCQYIVSGTAFDPAVTEACMPVTVTNDYNNSSSLDGAVFPVGGPYTITWTSTDPSGNVGTCSHMITVLDDVDPICVEQGTIDITINAGETIDITEALLTFPFTDNCGIDTVIFSPAVITCDDEGEFLVTATVSDDSGNEIDCPVIFNVIVNEDLMCSIIPDTLFLDIDGQFALDANSLVGLTGGFCGATPSITLSTSSVFCNDATTNPNFVTIFADGVECGVDSFYVIDSFPSVVFCSPETISCFEFENTYDGDIEQVLATVPAYDSIVGNCASFVTKDTVLDLTGLGICNYGEILRTVTTIDQLSGINSSCTQTITISGPTDSLTQVEVNGIIADTVNITDCMSGNVSTDSIKVADLEALSDCGQFTVDFMDVSISEGCPDTIIRTYTIDAICQEEVFSFVQVIIVNDDVDPIISAISDTTVIANAASCSSFFDMTGVVDVTDNCSTDIGVTYDFDGTGGIGIDSISILDVGDYMVTVTATDACGNTATEIFDVMVVDTSDFMVTCLKIQVTIDTITENYVVNALEGISITGNCSDDINIFATYSETDLTDTTLTVDCDILGEPILPTIWIWEITTSGDTIPFDLSPDVDGITNDCKIQIELLDPTNFCGSTIFGIQGEITTPQGAGVPDYRMILHGSGTDPVMSDFEGAYAFQDMPIGGSYVISTYNNNDVLDGVSTLDLIMIQRHILGLAEFDSPYKYIAADINNSETITGSDLLALRKVLLGIDIEFPNNLSWRTVDADHVFDDETDPWTEPIPEGYDIESLQSYMYIDFIGVKIGDINGNVSVNLQQETVSSTREDNTKKLYLESAVGQSRLISAEAISAAGMQFTLNTGELSIFRITSDIFDENQIGFYEVSNGVYNVSIANALAIEIDEEQELFSIEYSCTDCEFGEVSLDHKGLSPEIYLNSNLEVTPLVIESRGDAKLISAFSVQQNNPNPWSTYTKIDVMMKDAADVTLNIYDMNSRLIHTSTRSLSRGVSTIELDDSKVVGSGVYYYEISTGTERAQYKMIKLQ